MVVVARPARGSLDDCFNARIRRRLNFDRQAMASTTKLGVLTSEVEAASSDRAAAADCVALTTSLAFHAMIDRRTRTPGATAVDFSSSRLGNCTSAASSGRNVISGRTQAKIDCDSDNLPDEQAQATSRAIDRQTAISIWRYITQTRPSKGDR